MEENNVKENKDMYRYFNHLTLFVHYQSTLLENIF